jgi:serine/threonine protein kinase
MNLKHPCVPALFGFVVSSTWTELKIVRAYAPIGSLEEALQTSPSWWTVTVKSIAVAGIAPGMRFVHSFGLVCGNLKPSNILFDESHRIQIVDIIPNLAELHSRENFDENTREVLNSRSALSGYPTPSSTTHIRGHIRVVGRYHGITDPRDHRRGGAGRTGLWRVLGERLSST